MSEIKKIFAREVLDSRGNPTVEVDVYTRDHMGREMVPSGASTGAHEALELRDGGKRFRGLGVEKAVRNINKVIAPKLIGHDSTHQSEIDDIMLNLDGTPNKAKLGANAILGVSLACARVAAASEEMHMHEYLGQLAGNKDFRLPAPFMNIINGGKHAGGNIEFQEFMIVPMAKDFHESVRIASEVYHVLREHLKKNYGVESVNVGDEGGFAPHCHGGAEGVKLCTLVQEPLDMLTKAVDALGYGKEIKFAIDCASTSFYEKGRYLVRGKRIDGNDLLGIYEELCENYPIVSIEDPFMEEDFEMFAAMTKKLRKRIQIVGDDLTVTNTQRIHKAIEHKSCNCLLLKVNQIGSLSESLESAQLAMKHGWNVMVSHRSGETESHFIADLVVGMGTQQIKSGAPCRGERTAKYNQLLRIEEQLGSKAKFCKRDCWLK
jgi:enolase